LAIGSCPGHPFALFAARRRFRLALAPDRFPPSGTCRTTAGIALVAFSPDAEEPASLGPYRTGLSTLAWRSMRDVSELGIDELLDLLAQLVFPLAER
jgi:hypothetical protein